MEVGGPAVPARQLARELKRLREAAGKTQAEVGKWVGTPSTTISKIENAERNVPIPHLKLMLQLYGVDQAHSETLTQLAQQAREHRGWWADYGEAVPKWFTEYIGLESAASEVWTWEQEYVPGLLQTRRYTEATTGTTSESVEGFARVRATRQQRLTGETPVVLRAVLSEAVLRRQVGGPGVMREQVARLREAMSRPNISVRILPFSTGAHPGMTGPFTMLRFPERSMDMVYVELRGSAVYMEQPAEVDVHEAAFQRLSDLALSDDDTTSLLNEMERGY